MSPFGYPVNLELAGRRCVVIGELAVREGKVEGLVAGGATNILVLATAPPERLDELELLEGVDVRRRAWNTTDLEDAFVVIAHDADARSRDTIARAARNAGALVNLVDDIPNCDWAAPSVVRRGELLVAIGTGGGSPALAKKLRERLADEFGPEWAEVIRVLREVRDQTTPLLPDVRVRAERWRRALDPDEAALLVREGRAEELRTRLHARLVPEEAHR
jgi:siroheme synthase-like protein